MTLHAKTINASAVDTDLDEDHKHDELSNSLHQLIDHDHNPAQLLPHQAAGLVPFKFHKHQSKNYNKRLWPTYGHLRPPRSEIS